MTEKDMFQWYLKLVALAFAWVALLGFILPVMISAANTLSVANGCIIAVIAVPSLGALTVKTFKQIETK